MRFLNTWPVKLGALVLGAAVVIGFTSTAEAAVATVSAVPDNYTGFDNDVNSVVYLGNTVYLGGIFANAQRNGKLTPRAGLAAIDATNGTLLSWAPTVDGPVNAVAVDAASNTVYIAGTFTHVNGATRDGVAGIDASTGALTSFNHTIGGTPRALAVGAGHLYLGGSLTKVDGGTVSNVTAFSLATGAVDPSWSVTADDAVQAFAYDGSAGRLYIGGKFHKINGASGTNKLAAVDPATGVRNATFKAGLTVMVRNLSVNPAGGVFAALGGSGGRAVSLSATGAQLWKTTTDGDVQAVAYLNGVTYIGGHFDNVCATANVSATGGTCLDGSVSRVKFLAVDAGTGVLLGWDPHSAGVHGVLSYAVNTTLDTVAAGGEFSVVGGVYHKKFVQFGP